MKLTLMALLAATLLASTSARADVIATFNASGVFDDGSVLGGTLMIDETTGRISGSNLILTGPSSFIFSNIVNQSNTQVPGDYNVGDRNATSTEDFNFDLLDTAQTPLFNYNGGSICSASAPCTDGRGSNLYNLTDNTSAPISCQVR